VLTALATSCHHRIKGETMAHNMTGEDESPSRPKFVLYDRTESMWQSIASDAFTFCGLLVCIWFSQRMGGGVWEFVTLLMFTLWMLCCMPWERLTRTTKLRTKAQAQAWAEALPDDGA